jgi:hypothetical protein
MVREKTAPLVRPTIEATGKTLKEPRLEDHALQMRQTMPDFEFPGAAGGLCPKRRAPLARPLLDDAPAEKFVFLPQPGLAGAPRAESRDQSWWCHSRARFYPRLKITRRCLNKSIVWNFASSRTPATKCRANLGSSFLSIPASRQRRSSLAWIFLLTTGGCLNCRSRQLFSCRR